MTLAEYTEYVLSRCRDYTDKNYCVVALNEEAGEIAGWWKKFELRGNPTGKLTNVDLLGELGDLLFYTVRLANLFGWTIEDVMKYNKYKLDQRVASGEKSLG